MSKEFAAADLTLGQLNAIVKNLGGQEAALRFLRGELVVSKPIRSWREEDSVIYFSVTSDGTTGKEWIKRLEKQGDDVGDYAKSVLRSPDFKPTSNVTTKIAVLKGELFKDDDRVTKNIRAEAKRRKLVKPHAEVGCLVMEFLKDITDEEFKAMGLWRIVEMHDPIKDSSGGPYLLGAGRSGDDRWLGACYDSPGYRWDRDVGFAFAVPQV